jgi:hypothetical protein
MEVLIHDVERCAGDGEGEHGAEHGDAGPLGGRGGEEAAEDEESGTHYEEDGGALPEELAPCDRDVGDAKGLGDDLVKDRGLELGFKERGVVGEELGLEIVLDGGEVDGIVFSAGMVAHDQKGHQGKEQHEQGVTPTASQNDSNLQTWFRWPEPFGRCGVAGTCLNYN